MEEEKTRTAPVLSNSDVNKMSYMKHKFLNVIQGQEEYVY